jgi:hypothetical protein
MSDVVYRMMILYSRAQLNLEQNLAIDHSRTV